MGGEQRSLFVLPSWRREGGRSSDGSPHQHYQQAGGRGGWPWPLASLPAKQAPNRPCKRRTGWPGLRSAASSYGWTSSISLHAAEMGSGTRPHQRWCGVETGKSKTVSSLQSPRFLVLFLLLLHLSPIALTAQRRVRQCRRFFPTHSPTLSKTPLHP